MNNIVLKRAMKLGMSVLLVLSMFSGNVNNIFAADRDKGIEVNVDSTKLDQSVADAKNSGVEVTKGNTEDKGTVETNKQAAVKTAEIKADYNKQIEKLKAAKLSMDEYNKKKAEYDKLKEKYDKDLIQYNKDYKEYLKKYEAFKKQYEEEKKKMEEALKEYEKNKDKDGYLSSPYAKTLVYDLEPDAKLTLTDNQGKYISAKAVDNAFSHDTDNYNKKLLQLDNMSVKYLESPTAVSNKAELYGNFGTKSGWKTNISDNGVAKWATVLLKRGQSVTATYTNLKNSYYNGKKISKIVFKYTLSRDSAFKNNNLTAWLGIFTDPTLGVFASAYTGENEKDTSIFVKNEFTFYDQDGKPINFEDALLSVASLNREYNSIELAKDYAQGQFVRISGSSVDEDKTNKLIYATKSLNFKKGEGGARFSMYKRDGEADSGWDTADSPNSWYGAGAIKLQGPNNKITLGAASATTVLAPPHYGPQIPDKDNTDGKKPNIWYSLNGKIRAIGIPEIKAKEPEKPTPPTPPVEPEKPNAKITYHYSVFYVKSQVEKKVYDEQGQNINNKVVKKEALVKFELNTSDIPAGHEKIESLVFNDILPKGYEVNLEATKQANLNYDVAYDANTRLMTFTAKAELLNQINGDLSKDAKVPAPIITGKVTKEGTVYVNDFDLTINNEYSVKSKPVKVYTPTEPKKDVFKGSSTTSIDGKTVKGGEELRYEITYTNTTGTKQTVTVTDKIPQYTKFVSADNGGTESGGTITWVKEVEAGKSLTVSFRVKVDADVNGKPVDNVAHVKDGVNESDTNKTHNPTPTEPKKDVFKGSSTTSIDGKTVKGGEELRYEITYTNTTGTKQTVTVTDKIPQYTKFVSADNGGTESGGTITWVKEVEAGKSLTVSFRVKVDADVNGKPVDNVARVKDGVNESETNKTHNPTPKTPEKPTPDKPETGDNSNIMLYTLMLLTSGGVFGAIEFIRMRRRLREN